jgi:hypothetical protein
MRTSFIYAYKEIYAFMCLDGFAYIQKNSQHSTHKLINFFKGQHVVVFAKVLVSKWIGIWLHINVNIKEILEKLSGEKYVKKKL